MSRLRIRTEAELDLESASLYLEQQRADVGYAFLSEADHLFARIAAGPQLYEAREDGVRVALMRRFPYGAYYIADGEDVIVLAVLHLHRAPDTWRLRR